jgi:hypothetical protein
MEKVFVRFQVHVVMKHLISTNEDFKETVLVSKTYSGLLHSSKPPAMFLLNIHRREVIKTT